MIQPTLPASACSRSLATQGESYLLDQFATFTLPLSCLTVLPSTSCPLLTIHSLLWAFLAQTQLLLQV